MHNSMLGERCSVSSLGWELPCAHRVLAADRLKSFAPVLSKSADAAMLWQPE